MVRLIKNTLLLLAPLVLVVLVALALIFEPVITSYVSVGITSYVSVGIITICVIWFLISVGIALVEKYGIGNETNH